MCDQPTYAFLSFKILTTEVANVAEMKAIWKSMMMMMMIDGHEEDVELC